MLTRHVAILLIVIAGCLHAADLHAGSKNQHRRPPSALESDDTTRTEVRRGSEEAPLIVRTLPSEKTEAERAEEAKDRSEKAATDRQLVYFTAALAAFTAVLAVSTIALWWVTKGLRQFAAEQASDMKSSIAVARQAADAAQSSSEASVAVELPIFIVESEINIGRGIGRYSIPFGNHGRTPAVMTSDCLVLQLDSSLPPLPCYPIDSVERVGSSRIVERGHEYLVSRPASISDGNWDRIMKRECILWAYGYIEYIDFLKTKRIDGFCLAFEPVTSPMYPSSTPSDGVWVREGPSAYVYNRPSV